MERLRHILAEAIAALDTLELAPNLSAWATADIAWIFSGVLHVLERSSDTVKYKNEGIDELRRLASVRADDKAERYVVVTAHTPIPEAGITIGESYRTTYADAVFAIDRNMAHWAWSHEVDRTLRHAEGYTWDFPPLARLNTALSFLLSSGPCAA